MVEVVVEVGVGVVVEVVVEVGVVVVVVSQLKDFVEGLRSEFKKDQPQREFFDWVLANGIRFYPKNRLPVPPQGTLPNACFHNSQKLDLISLGKFRYFEGWGLYQGQILGHAWNSVYPESRLADSTWWKVA